MWLRDFLPEDRRNCRVMTFNHNSAWKTGAQGKSLEDFAHDFLLSLRMARATPEVRVVVAYREPQ